MSGLSLAIALTANKDIDERADIEAQLFSTLKEISNQGSGGIQRTVEMPGSPTFLPHLLTFGDRTPQQLLKRALDLRNESVVNEYRVWWNDTVRELQQGRMSVDRSKEVQRLAEAIQRKIKPADDASIKLTLSLSDVGAEKEIFYQQVWGWVLRQLPGYRYRKLLMRLVIAQHEYLRIDQHLRQMWNS